MKLAIIAVAVAALAGLVLLHAADRDERPMRQALAAHVAGVSADDAGYSRIGPALRARAWLLSAPHQPDGVALFAGLPDAQFRPERVIVPADLREAMAHIRGLTWDPQAQAWSGGGRQVALAEVRRLLEASLPTPTDAAAVIDLLLGQPAPGAPPFASLLQADPPSLTAIRFVPFRGARGRLLVDRGRPPLIATESAYLGLVASFEGAGWPSGWRVLSLRSAER